MSDSELTGTSASVPHRHLPLLTEANSFFWQAGERSKLLFTQCEECRRFIHPPTPACPRCRSRRVTQGEVSGKAVVESYTINYHSWERGLQVPYVIAIVSIVEQPNVRLTTNIVKCTPEAVYIGMRVQVVFERHGDVWLPLFEPDNRPGQP